MTKPRVAVIGTGGTIASIGKGPLDILDYGEESVSLAFEEIPAKHWAEKVYRPDILGQPEKLYKKPGYDPPELP